MKANKNFFTGLFLLTIVTILSCNSNNYSEAFRLQGKWLMKVTERGNQNSTFNSITNADTTFNSLFQGMTYIPDNSEWNFVNDSVLIVRKLNDHTYKPDTLVYKISQNTDTLILFSKDVVEKYPLKILSASWFELDFGDLTVSYQLNSVIQ